MNCFLFPKLFKPKPGSIFFWKDSSSLLLVVRLNMYDNIYFYNFITGTHRSMDSITFNSFLNDNTITKVNLHQSFYNSNFDFSIENERATIQEKNTNYLYSNNSCLYYYDRPSNTLINLTTQSIPEDENYEKEIKSLTNINSVFRIQIYDEDKMDFIDLRLS